METCIASLQLLKELRTSLKPSCLVSHKHMKEELLSLGTLNILHLEERGLLSREDESEIVTVRMCLHAGAGSAGVIRGQAHIPLSQLLDLNFLFSSSV